MGGTILVGVDASNPSRSALAWSVARAVATGARLALLHVVELESPTGQSAEYGKLRKRAEALLHTQLAYARSLDPALQIIATLAEGQPCDVLVKRSNKPSLLVVGTHKTGFIYGRTFGSRFLGLGSRAHCNVAFIPDRLGYDRTNVVVGVDDTSSGDAAVLFAAAEAARSRHELVIVSSWGAIDHAPCGEDASARRAASLARAVLLASESQTGLRVRARVAEHPAAEALIEASARAAMLVIARSRSSWATSASRAANHDVLLNMASPVMVVLENGPQLTERN